MDIKIKENVNVNSYTFKKRVLEEAIELLGRKRNYVLNDIKFIAMITFVNNLVDNNLVIETLYKEEDIEQKMETVIEPLFDKEVVKNPERIAAFEEVVNELVEYMEREVKIRLTLSGFLYDLSDELGEMKVEDVMNIINSIIDKTGLKNLQPAKSKKVKKKTDEELRQEAIKDIENAKMKAFIEKYVRENQDKKVDAKE